MRFARCRTSRLRSGEGIGIVRPEPFLVSPVQSVLVFATNSIYRTRVFSKQYKWRWSLRGGFIQAPNLDARNLRQFTNRHSPSINSAPWYRLKGFTSTVAVKGPAWQADAVPN
jgi:hypothetical protein